MKDNFLSLVANVPQNTGGGNSQTKRATLALPLRYLCAMLFAFILAIGNVWADEWTAAEIAKKDGSVNVGTTKNHLTVSSPGVTSVTNAKYAKISGSEVKRDGVEINGAATSGSLVETNILSIKTDRGYKLVSPVKVNGHSSSTTEVKAAYVGWEGQPTNTFTLCNGATEWKFQKNSATTEPADNEITFSTTIRSIYIYKQIKTATDAYNSFGTSKTVGNNTKFYIASVTASAVLAPEIEGESQMFNDETISLVGYPAGGTWGVKAGDPGTITADGKLTATGNGTIHVTYTVDEVEETKEIVAAATKTLVWNFDTKDVLPTTAGITATNVGGTFETAGQLKLDNGAYVAIDLTSKDYIITAASINARTGSDSKLINFGSALSTTADGNVNSSNSYADIAITPVKSSSIFSLSKNNSGVYVAKITLTVKKAVACTVAPTVSATTKGATTSTTQVVNCAGISSLGSEGCSISSYGFVYGTGETPNIDDDTPVEVGTSYSTINTAFAETTLTGLTPSTTYYVRAYATNGFGTAYGSAVSFTTSAACTVAPTVSTISKGTTSYTTQVMNCAGITAIGSAGCAISSYGFVYGTTEHPTTANTTKEVGTSYTVVETAFAETTLTGLTPNTTYYVRAYATNEYGTAYSSNELSFTTLETIGNVAFIASSASVTNDAITALRDAGYNVTVRTKAAEPNYTGVDLVVLDESSGWDSSSDEVGTVIGVNVPILNLKAFFYTLSNRWNWGTPVNPSTSELATLSTEYTNISSHPIFDGVTITAGAVDMVNPSKSGNNLQGVTTSTLVEGKRGYTLATSATGTTCIHELTPAQRGVSTAKYLLIALSSNIKDNYSDDAKKMIVNAAKYLIGNTSWEPVVAPTLSSSVPANNATDVAVEGNIVLTFSQNVTVLDASKFTLTGGAGTLNTAGITVSDAVVTIPYSGLANSTTYTFSTAAGAVKNAGDVPNAALSNIEFTTEAACTKPGMPANLAASNLAYTTADLSWDAAANSDGYKISIIKKDDENVIVDWTDNATTSYAATGLTQGTEYTFKVKAKGATGYCEFGLEATVDFKTTAPSVADLVTISDDYTFTPSVSIPAGTLSADSKFFAAGTGDCDMSDGKMRVKENRALAFKVADNAKIKVTFATKSGRQIQLGTALSEGNYTTYGSSESSPYTFDVVTTGGVVYLTAHSDQLYFSKLEITYPHTVTYDLNGGTGDPVPTQASKYVGETFTAHDGVTGITAPTGKEFSKWKDQDEADVLGGATYTMPAKAVTLTAQWIDPPTRYTVSFDLQGHGSAITSQSVADGEKALKPADPSESGWDFEGWYTDAACTAGNEFDFNTAIIADRPLFAKWTEFDACAVLTPATSGETIGVGDEISLQTGSVGGTMEAVVKSGSTSTTLAYTENGLSFGSSGNTSRVKVTLSHKLQKGSIIRVTLKANGENTSDRGLDLYNEAEAKKGFLGFAKNGYENGDVAKFSYVVTDDDGLKNTKVFYLYRNNSVWMADLKVANCAPQDFTVTYKDGETTLGTEDVFENGHPTATGVNTRKNGYVFDGWAETDGGAVVNLSTITITAAKTLYAKYTARDCSGIGSKFKFVVATDQSNGNLMASAPNSMALTTENYLSELAGGELVASIEGTNNNRITYSDKKGISFPNGDGGKLTIKLDCPLQENDEIRFINYASNGNGLTLSDGTNSLELPSNNASIVQTITVPAAWETTASYELTLVRVSGKTPKISYFEIYRRPALESVMVADLTVREGASVTPVMTLTPSDALVTSQVWSIVSGDDKIDIDPATGEVTGVAAGDAEIKVVLNGIPAMSATATVHVVETFVQEDVTESITWDFSKAGATSQFNEQVLANVDGVTLDASQFDGRKLVGSAQNITSPYLQGTMLTFNTTVKGLLSVRFTSGNNNPRVLKVYVGDPEVEIASWNYSGAATENKSIEVPAGKVTLRSYQGENPNNVRILRMAFQTPDHVRTEMLGNGVLGTICVPNNVPVSQAFGATFYELVGREPQYGKIAFDEIVSGELTAGKPYVFQAHGDNLTLYYGTTSVTAPVNGNGMYGTFEAITLPDDVPAIENLNDIYYFAQGALWSCVDLTSLSVPANRAYVKLSEIPDVPTQQPAPGRRRITLGVQGEQVATGIENGELNEAPRKVLINGELFILRGEKMYDAKGQLVK